MSTPDYGRSACYRAEHAVWYKMDIKLTKAEVVKTVAEVHRRCGDGKSVPTCDFPAKSTRIARAWTWARKIQFLGADYANSLMLVLHELAHIYSPADTGHGPEWRRKYLSMVAEMIGDAEAKILAESFAKHGVPADAVAAKPVRRAETRPRRKFVLIYRMVLSETSSTVGNLTTVDQTFSEWKIYDGSSRAGVASFNLNETQKKWLRDGYYVYQTIQGIKHQFKFGVDFKK